jgi:kynureninase
MKFEAKKQFAKQCDREDPLRKFRKEFYFPGEKKKKSVYLCGNSLGLLSKNVKPAIEQELKDWKNKAIAGYLHAKHPWMYYQHHFNKPLSGIMGTKEHEVTVMNGLTVNLHLLLLSFYQPTQQRFKIIMEAGAFPSDQYAVASQVKFHAFDPQQAIIEVVPAGGQKTLRTEDIIRVIEEHKDTVAIVLFGGINYYTGQLFNIKDITSAAHRAGAYAGFDLAHVAGNVPMHLHDWEVDFAVWCSYKYLNAGPGSVAGIYIHEKFANDLEFRRLAGWWGNEEKTRFQMVRDFTPQPGAAGWSISTAQVFNMVALRASLKIIDKAGIENIRNKSIQLTGYLEYLLGELDNLDFEIVTPANPAERGAQLSLFFRERGKEVHEQMIKEGIVVDYREPGVIRVAPAPLYNSFRDVYRFYEILKGLNSSH